MMNPTKKVAEAKRRLSLLRQLGVGAQASIGVDGQRWKVDSITFRDHNDCLTTEATIKLTHPNMPPMEISL